jgi:hypothetical protein
MLVASHVAKIFLFGFLLALAFLSLAPDPVLEKTCGDCEGGYVSVARNLIDSNGFIDKNGNFATARPPGHPLFLSGVLVLTKALGISEITAFRGANALLFALIGVVLSRIAQRTWGDNGPAITTVLCLWFTSPFSLFFLTAPYSELPFILTYFVLFLVVMPNVQVRHEAGFSYFLLIGILCGVAMMIRPLAIGLPVVVGIALICWTNCPQRMGYLRVVSKKLIGVLVGVILVTGPWSTYVYKNTGHMIFLTDGTLTQNSLVNGFTFASRGEDYRVPIYLPTHARTLMSSIEAALVKRSTLETEEEMTKSVGPIIDIVLREVTLNKVGALELLGTKIIRSWFGTDSHRYENYSLTLVLIYGSLIILGFIQIMRRNLVSKPLVFFVLGLTAYFWVLCVIFEPLVRYLVPQIGLLFLFVPGIWRGNTLQIRQR